MGIHHQAFNCKLNIIIAIIIFTLSVLPLKAYAQDEVFVVDHILVDVTAQDSVAAQNEAYARAQGLAFEKLKRRLVEETQLANITDPDFDTVANFVQDYEITNERISSVRYVGTYRFRFRPDEVRRYFSGVGVSYTTQSSKPLLVLPIFQRNGVNTLWSEQNLWMQAWGDARISGGLVPVEVPMGDLSDITDINDESPLRYERSKLDSMLARYGASEATIMIAVPDEMLLAVAQEDEVAMGRLRVIIYRTDRSSAEYVGEFTLTAQMQETRSDLYMRAVQKAYGTLQKDWKKHNAVSSEQKARYQVIIPVQNLKQWVKIKADLLSMPAISDFEQDSLKRSEIVVSFDYRGNGALLAQNLARKNLTLVARDSMEHGSVHSGPYVNYLYTPETLPKQPAAVMPQAGGDFAQESVQQY